MDVARLWKEIAHDSDLWALCGVAMALGIVGGIAQAFASADGGRPGWRTLLQRGLLGAVAPGAVLYFGDLLRAGFIGFTPYSSGGRPSSVRPERLHPHRNRPTISG